MKAVSSEGYTRRARELSRVLRQKQGLDKAVRLIEPEVFLGAGGG